MPNPQPIPSPTLPGHDPQAARRSLFAYARHELRTPLNAILGYSELILEDMEEFGSAYPPRVSEDLKRINRIGKELLGLVDSLFEPETFARSLGCTMTEYPGRISHALRTPLTSVIGFCEILLEETTDDPGNIRAELQRILSAGQHMVEVTEETIPLLQADVASAPLASTPTRNDADPEPPVRTPGGRVGAELVTGARLLVVDDSETNRDLLSRRIRRYGHHVVTAQNGVEALELVRAQEFDIILLDVIMPELDGYETLKRFKEDPALRDIPVVMISALDEMDSVARCIEQGAEDYLPKTFDPILLQARIVNCLEKKAFRDREKQYLNQIESEKRRADALLRVILPEPIIQELHTTNTVKPRLYDDVAVLFCDIVDFTSYCSERPPSEVIANLQEMIEQFEQIALRFGVQKIKTIGDSFMGTAGLITAVDQPVHACIECGLRMVECARELASGWDVRVGIHVGPVVAGVVGHQQYQFDLWGDTVNTAARVESSGANGGVNVSAHTWLRIAGEYSGVSLGYREMKGKGNIEIFRITRL